MRHSAGFSILSRVRRAEGGAHGEKLMNSAQLAWSALALCTAALFSDPAAAATALTHTDVDLHSGPGTKFMTVGDVGANSKVGVLWCGGADFDWCLIQFHNKQGWVSLKDLTDLGTAGSTAQAGGSETQTGGIGKLPHESVMRAAPAGSQVTITPSNAKAVGSGL
jgi:uncharacterized protein YraI